MGELLVYLSILMTSFVVGICLYIRKGRLVGVEAHDFLLTSSHNCSLSENY